MKKLLILFFILLATLFLYSRVMASEPTTLLFFWAEGCPHCALEDKYLSKLQTKHPELKIEKYEVSRNKDNQLKLVNLSRELKFDANGVPVTIVGDEYLLGYTEGITDKKIDELILNAKSVEETSQEVCEIDAPCEEDQEGVNQKIKLPFLGQIETKSFSLPMLAIVIGALDGFNPCAMWTLLFLISLLLGMKDKKRMWALGTAFIIASAAVYFVFMAAWLNLLLFIGMVATVRIIIALVALIGGAYSLKDYFTNKDAACKVTGDEKRKKVFDKLKHITHERSFIVALLGIIALAFAVNLVELICSAGLPAVFTQILTLSDLPSWQYYLYIALYIFFFMLDDLFVFFVAMITLQATGITTKYSRASRLIGGLIMVAIGLVLIFKPAWLMFG